MALLPGCLEWAWQQERDAAVLERRGLVAMLAVPGADEGPDERLCLFCRSRRHRTPQDARRRRLRRQARMQRLLARHPWSLSLRTREAIEQLVDDPPRP